MLYHFTDYEDTLSLLRQVQTLPLIELCWSEREQRWQAYQEDKPVFDVRMPLLFPLYQEGKTLTDYLLRVPTLPPNYLILLIQAGNAALGHYEADILLNHKVVRKYMVRAKQGKAQINHLKTKGKSRAGSRIRLAQTDEFFDEIVEKLLDWEVENVDLIFYSAAIHWWNNLFEADNLPPFEKDDERLRKIPLDVNTPNFEELQHVQQFIRQAHWRYEEAWENELFPI